MTQGEEGEMGEEVEGQGEEGTQDEVGEMEEEVEDSS